MKPNILIVDDENVILQVHEAILEDNFKTFTAKNGFRALEIFKSEKEIPVLITDIEMPEMNGLELVNEVFKISPLTRIVFVSGLKEQIQSLLSLNKEFFCLVKPVMPSFVSLAARLAYTSWKKAKKNQDYDIVRNESLIDKSILVVDDNPIVLETHLAALDKFMNVISADNGRDAWELYKKECGNVAVVVTDIEMPLMDGKELIRKIRANNSKTQIIAITGNLDEKLSNTLLKYNVYCLPKPTDPLLVELAVSSSFSRYFKRHNF